MNNFILFSQTYRVLDYDISKKHPAFSTTPNCGLSCYLGEAFTDANITHSTNRSVKELVAKLMGEARENIDINNKLCWGWEKVPTIIDTEFPFDWDDTSKALDFLFSASDKRLDDRINLEKLPDQEDIKRIFKNSMFTTRQLFNADITQLKCPFTQALFVFFGHGSEDMIKRDDPMVTISTIRMIGKCYPTLLKDREIRKDIIHLMKRCIYVLNLLMKNNSLRFSDFSRYYFSLSHYAFRVVETLDILRKYNINCTINYCNSASTMWKRFSCICLKSNHKEYSNCKQIIDIELLKQMISIAYAKYSNKTVLENEDFWWLIIGTNLEYIQLNSDIVQLLNDNYHDRIVYQHIRQKHQYYSPGWEKKLLEFEFIKLDRNISKVNNLSLKGVRFQEKEKTPVFALSSLMVFIISCVLERNNIKQKIVAETSLLTDITTEGFPYLDLIFSLILIIIGTRMYLHAWAIDETFLIQRIISQVSSKKKKIVRSLEFLTRFLWTMSAMLIPITISKFSWHYVILAMYAALLIWNITIQPSLKRMFKELERDYKPIFISWIIFDGVSIICLLIIIFLLDLNILGFDRTNFQNWPKVISLILFIIIAIFTIIQSFVFVKLLRNSKIIIRYESF